MMAAKLAMPVMLPPVHLKAAPQDATLSRAEVAAGDAGRATMSLRRSRWRYLLAAGAADAAGRA